MFESNHKVILTSATTILHASGTTCQLSTIVYQKIQLAREAEKIRREIIERSEKALKRRCETEEETAVRKKQGQSDSKKNDIKH